MAGINKSRELDEGKTQDNTEGHGRFTSGKLEFKPVRASNYAAKDNEGQPEGITVKVDVDVSEALTGLKAVTREAKAATKAVKELGVVSDNRQHNAVFADYVHVGLSVYSTKMLTEELAKRKSGSLTEMLRKITEDNRHDAVE